MVGIASPAGGRRIDINPTSASIALGSTQQFTVNGTIDTNVIWSVDAGGDPFTHAGGFIAGVGGNPGLGTISDAGLFTAPTSTSVGLVSVTATDKATCGSSNPILVAFSNFTGPGGGGGGGISVVVTPSSATVLTFGTMQFSASVTGTTNTAVNWKVNCAAGGSACGAISQNGLYTAPNSVPTKNQNGASVLDTVTVAAVSQADSTSSGFALVTVVAPNQNAQSIPVKLGASGGNANDFSSVGCGGGTLGSLVSRGGNQYILSNNHVIARRDSAAIGESIIQPGLQDANCNSGGTATVARLTQFFNLETGPTPKVDAALAQVVAGTVDSQGTVLQLGGTTIGRMPTNGPPHSGSGVTATVNRTVAKSGRSTGLTCSTVLATNVATSVLYHKGPADTGPTFTVNFSNQVGVAGGNFSAEGDSGSLIVTQDTADPVALLFAGSDRETLGNPISDVLNALADPNTHERPVFVGASSTHPVAACGLPGPQSAMGRELALQRVAPPSDAISRAIAVRDAHTPELMAHPEVQAVGVDASLDQPGQAAILLFVTKGMARTNLPAEVEGVRTRIIEGDLFPNRGVLSAAESGSMEQAAGLPPIVTPVSDSEVARAHAVHDKRVDELMQVAGVQGVGITSSADAPGEAALMVFLVRGASNGNIPAVIDGVRTRIRESSRFRAGFGDKAEQHSCSFPRTPLKASRPAGARTRH